jgi:hypothetical protein
VFYGKKILSATKAQRHEEYNLKKNILCLRDFVADNSGSGLSWLSV